MPLCDLELLTNSSAVGYNCFDTTVSWCDSDLQNGACPNVLSGACLIDGVWVANGVYSDQFQCQKCIQSESFDSFSVATGDYCDDGNSTTCNDVCLENASCAGTPTECPDDGISCTGKIFFFIISVS